MGKVEGARWYTPYAGSKQKSQIAERIKETHERGPTAIWIVDSGAYFLSLFLPSSSNQVADFSPLLDLFSNSFVFCVLNFNWPGFYLFY